LCSLSIIWVVQELVRDAFTEEGGGNVQYPVLREFVGHCAKRMAKDGGVASEETRATFVRTAAYFAELADLGAALIQIRAPLSGRRSTARRAGILKLLGILRASGTRVEMEQRAQLLLDMRVADVIVPVSQKRF
jgi:hypothetical protein